MLRKVSVAINVLRKNGFLGELQCLADNPPTLKMEDSANIKMVLQGTFKKNVLDRWKHYVEFDPLTDALQPVLTINGVKYELGIFLPTTVSPSYKDTDVEETIEIEAYDRSWLVATTTGTERVFFARGTAYMEAIEQLLVASGIALIKSTPCTDVLREDREDWDLGTDYLTIINDLLKEINYKQLWFDNTGTAIIEPIDTPMVNNIKHILDARNVTSLVRPGLSRKLDIYSIPNVFICTCNNPEKSAVLTAVSRNENDHSPLSIHRRGREIVYYENVNNVASQDALQAYADRLLFISLMSGESLSVTTSLLPDWGIGDIVSLHYLDIHALCVSHSWNMTLAAGGAMTHELEKIVYNLDPGIYGDDEDDDDDDDLLPYRPWDDDKNLPDEIRIITLPNKLVYVGDDAIDLTGIVVKAYREGSVWTNEQYPDGIIPIEELQTFFNYSDTHIQNSAYVTGKTTILQYSYNGGTITSVHEYNENCNVFMVKVHGDSYISLDEYVIIEKSSADSSFVSNCGTKKFTRIGCSNLPDSDIENSLVMPFMSYKNVYWARSGTVLTSDVHDATYTGPLMIEIMYADDADRIAHELIDEYFDNKGTGTVIVSWARPVDENILSDHFEVSVIAEAGECIEQQIDVNPGQTDKLPTKLDVGLDPVLYNRIFYDGQNINFSRYILFAWECYEDGTQAWGGKIEYEDISAIERTGRTLVETVVPAEIPELNIAHEAHGSCILRGQKGETASFYFEWIPSDENAIVYTRTEYTGVDQYSYSIVDSVVECTVISAEPGSFTDHGHVYSLQPLLDSEDLMCRFGGKQVYTGGGGHGYEEGFSLLSVEPEPSNIPYGLTTAQIWTLVHGSYNVYKDTYTVSAPRKEDGQIITGTFEITVRG